MHIDIKERNPAIIQPFCQMIREYGRSGQVLVASFHADILKAFRRIYPEAATSASKPEIQLFYALSRVRLGAFYSPRVGAIQVSDSVGRIRIVTRRFTDTAHRHGMKVYVWTVNQVGEMRRLLNLGVDGIITDFPDRLLLALDRQI
jgi:glycerophosphoryl diester phosphodiesterase